MLLSYTVTTHRFNLLTRCDIGRGMHATLAIPEKAQTLKIQMLAKTSPVCAVRKNAFIGGSGENPFQIRAQVQTRKGFINVQFPKSRYQDAVVAIPNLANLHNRVGSIPSDLGSAKRHTASAKQLPSALRYYRSPAPRPR